MVGLSDLKLTPRVRFLIASYRGTVVFVRKGIENLSVAMLQQSLVANEGGLVDNPHSSNNKFCPQGNNSNRINTVV